MRTLGEVVAQRLRRYREQGGLTQQQVAERTAQRGYTISRGTLAKLEVGGTRADNLSLVDLLVLADALDVPPVLLFLPLGEEEVVQITPGTNVHPHLAMEWIAGEETFSCEVENENGKKVPMSSPWDVRQWQRNSLPVRMFRRLRELQDASQSTEATDEDRRRLADHLDYMRDAALIIPEGVEELTKPKDTD